MQICPKRATASDMPSAADVKAAMDRWLPFSLQCPENWPSSWQESYWQKNNIFITVTDQCFFKFIFNCSWITMLYILLLFSKVTLSIYTHIYEYTFFFILFSILVYHRIEYSSLCYIVGPCYLSILYIPVCIC